MLPLHILLLLLLLPLPASPSPPPPPCPPPHPPHSLHPLPSPPVQAVSPSLYLHSPSSAVVNGQEWLLPGRAAGIVEVYGGAVVIGTEGDVYRISSSGMETLFNVAGSPFSSPAHPEGDEMSLPDEDDDYAPPAAPAPPSVHVSSPPSLAHLPPPSGPSLLVCYSLYPASASLPPSHFYAIRPLSPSLPPQSVALDAPCYVPPTVRRGVHYLPLSDGTLLSLTPSPGSPSIEVTASYSAPSPLHSSPLIIASSLYLPSGSSLLSLSLSLTLTYSRPFPSPISSPPVPVSMSGKPAVLFTTTSREHCVSLHVVSARTGKALPGYPIEVACGHRQNVVPRPAVVYFEEGGDPVSPGEGEQAPVLRGSSSSSSPPSQEPPSQQLGGGPTVYIPVASALYSISLLSPCPIPHPLSAPSLLPPLLSPLPSGSLSVSVLTPTDIVTFDSGLPAPLPSPADDPNLYVGDLSASLAALNALPETAPPHVRGSRVKLQVKVAGGGGGELTLVVHDAADPARVLHEGVVGRGLNAVVVRPDVSRGGRELRLVARVSTEGGVAVTAELDIGYNVDGGGLVEGIVVAVVVLLAVGTGAKAIGGGDGREDRVLST